MSKTIIVTKEEACEAAPQWVKDDIEPVKELYHSSLSWRIKMFEADNAIKQNFIRQYAIKWSASKEVITLAEAEKRWNKTNLRQNPEGYPHRWKSGKVWLTTVYAMEMVYGSEPAEE